MNTPQQSKSAATRLGGWLPKDPKQDSNWIRKLKKSVAQRPCELVEPI
ncbi:MAG: hypothetical protein U1F76_23140 [Candidatus Competibacteraceae bacterium]